MAKYTVEVTRILAAHVEVDASSPDEAVHIARQMNEDGQLAFFDPEIEDEFNVMESTDGSSDATNSFSPVVPPSLNGIKGMTGQEVEEFLHATR